jgi:hypothetical protein
MKSVLLLLIVSTLFITNLFSQIKKGTWMTGGVVGFSKSKGTTDYNYPGTGVGNTIDKYWNVNLNGGYFLRDNLLIGLSPGYSNNSHHFSGQGTSLSYNLNSIQQDNYQISPFIRKYKQLFNSKTYIFVQASAKLFYRKSSYDFMTSSNGSTTYDDQSYTTSYGEGISFSPGINYFITDKIALEATFAGLSISSYKENYSRQYMNQSNSNSSNYTTRHLDYQFNLNIMNINLGVQIFLRKKQEAPKIEGM